MFIGPRIYVTNRLACAVLIAAVAVVPKVAVSQEAGIPMPNVVPGNVPKPVPPAPATADVIAPATESDQAQEPSAITTAPAAFDVRAIDVAGVTLLTPAEIEKLVYPFVGEGKSSADVESARKAIQDAYVAKGFEAVIVETPPQTDVLFAQGLIQLKVNEVPVNTVSVTGAKYHSTKSVAKSIPSLSTGKPIDFKALQAEINAANRFPDRSITPRFKAGTTPGTIEAELRVRDEFPLHATFELNNDNSPNTTPLRLSGSARYTNLWGAGHSVTAGFVIAPQNKNDSAVISLSYSAPLLATPWTLVGYGYRSNSNIAALGGTNVLGNGYQLGARAIYRLPTDKAYHGFSFGLDYKNFKQDILIKGTALKSPVEYIPLVLGYSFSQGSETTQIEANLNTTLGLRVLRRQKCGPNSTITVCFEEDGVRERQSDSFENFSHINLDVNWVSAFKGDWVAAAKFSGQYADSRLVTNEQFAAGGLSTVRGYFQSEVVGDDGFTGSIEFRAPSLATYLGAFVDEFRLFSFAEFGLTRVLSPLPEQQSVFKIGSFGGGARVKLLKRLSGEVAVGVPVLSSVTTRKGDPRVTFTAKSEF
jgi:hemolysin activation/secretion protein